MIGQKLDQHDEIAGDKIQINAQFTHWRIELDLRQVGQYCGNAAHDDCDAEDNMLGTNDSP